MCLSLSRKKVNVTLRCRKMLIHAKIAERQFEANQVHQDDIETNVEEEER